MVFDPQDNTLTLPSGVRRYVIYAARVFPTIAASTLTLIALCGGLALLLHLIVGTDPLTAYLATSPGGSMRTLSLNTK